MSAFQDLKTNVSEIGSGIVGDMGFTPQAAIGLVAPDTRNVIVYKRPHTWKGRPLKFIKRKPNERAFSLTTG